MASDFALRLALLQYAGTTDGLPLATAADKIPSRLILAGHSQPTALRPDGELNVASLDAAPATPDPGGKGHPAAFTDFGSFMGMSGSSFIGTDGRWYALATDGCCSSQEFLDDVATADEIIQFVKGHIPSLRASRPTPIDESNPGAQIAAYSVSIDVNLNADDGARPLRSGGSGVAPILVTFVTDDSCLNCSGIGKIRCRACNKGVQSEQINTVGSVGGGLYPRVQTYGSDRVFRQCSNCRGTGVVDCPFCSRGEDVLGR